MTRRKTTQGLRPAAISFTDEGGRNCVRVPLDPYGRAYATVTDHDYRRIKATGIDSPWYLNRNDRGQKYVRIGVPDGKGGTTLVMAARLVTDAGPRSTVYFRNGDRLDLRPENLHEHHKGKAKRRDVDVVRRGVETRRAGRRSAAP